MKKLLFILLVLNTYNLIAQPTRAVPIVAVLDTGIVSDDDEIIDEVIKAPATVNKEKIKYVSQVTKYGFKNLFNNYSYNPTIPYSSQVNPYAESYMQGYLRGNTTYLQGLKKTAVPYFNLIDNILSQYGLPRELKYLAVIESNLKSNATSVVGARGPWQFMSYTAKDYGLQINRYVDDRTDYYKSTHAAAKYLLSLYKDLKDWLLVVAAYNGGPGRVYEAIRKSGSRNFWSLQYYLPEESRNHVKKFIATHYIMETGNNSGFNYNNLSESNVQLQSSLTDEQKSADVLTVSGKYKAAIIAKNIEIDLVAFNKLNPGFDITLTSGNTYDLRLPADKMDIFVAKKYDILNECVQTLLSDVNMQQKTSYSKKKITAKRK
ncbi:hypothetical protein BH09BAC2_BH09BAC2_08080 [soil metagenome]